MPTDSEQNPANTAEITLFEGHPAVLGSATRLVIAVATLGLAAVYFWLQSSSTKYLITSQRVVVEAGVFSKNIEALELYLIADIELEKPFAQRLMGTGNITLLAHDSAHPSLRLTRLPLDVRKLYEQLRLEIEKCKFLRRSYYREG